MDQSDAALLSRVRAGDLAAFDMLYARYSPRLFGYLCRVVWERGAAEELLQETFMAVLKDRRCDPDRCTFAAWLFQVARNLSVSRGRRVARDAAARQAFAATADPLTASAPAVETPETLVQKLEAARALDAALAGLSPQHRETLLLKELGQLTYQEIARTLGVPEGTVKSRLHHAVRAMQSALSIKESPDAL